MLSKSADPSPETPSQAPDGEGVETGWEPPDRVMAKVKAQSRPRTLVERRRKPKWYGIRRVLVRAQEGQLRARRRYVRRRASCFSIGALPALTRRFTVGGTPQFEPRPPAWAIKLYHCAQRLL